jgi:hypothetical protein
LQKVTANTIHNAKRKLEKELAYNSYKNGKKIHQIYEVQVQQYQQHRPTDRRRGKLDCGSKLMADELNNFFMSVFTMEN